MTRYDELQAAAHAAGYLVRRWRPGDGRARYRFFELTKLIPGEVQTYDGPINGVHTALGLKQAWKFLERDRHQHLDRIYARRTRKYRGR